MINEINYRQFSLRQRGFEAANEFEMLSKHVTNKNESTLYQYAAFIIRHLASHIPSEKPNLKVVK